MVLNDLSLCGTRALIFHRSDLISIGVTTAVTTTPETPSPSLPNAVEQCKLTSTKANLFSRHEPPT
jgi:hypothetical protein